MVVGGLRGNLEEGTVSIERHLSGGVVHRQQSAAHFAEGRKLMPAGLHRARTGNAVALAGHRSVVVDRLRTRDKIQYSSLRHCCAWSLIIAQWF